MSPVIVVCVLFAAVLHGGWNAIAKGIPDRLAASSLIGAAHLVVGFIGLWFVPAPAPASIIFFILSSLVQTGYLILLTASYKFGDFSQVYPLARGLAVLAVTVFSTVVLGEYLSPGQSAGVALVTAALLSLVLLKGSVRAAGHNRKGLLLAVLTGLTIATYSLIDGVGVR